MVDTIVPTIVKVTQECTTEDQMAVKDISQMFTGPRFNMLDVLLIVKQPVIIFTGTVS